MVCSSMCTSQTGSLFLGAQGRGCEVEIKHTHMNDSTKGVTYICPHGIRSFGSILMEL